MTLTSHQIRHGRLADTQVSGDTLLRLATEGTEDHFFGIDINMRFIVPSRPSADRPVSHVVSVQPDVQVSRVYTMPDVTGVENEFAIRDGAVCQFPRHAVSQPRQIHVGHLPVAVGDQRSGPQPTSVGAINSVPELLNESGFSRCGVHTETLLPLYVIV